MTSRDDRVLSSQCLFNLQLVFKVLLDEVLVFAVVADPIEFVSLRVPSSLPQMLKADRVLAEVTKYPSTYHSLDY